MMWCGISSNHLTSHNPRLGWSKSRARKVAVFDQCLFVSCGLASRSL
jgi:hypothetical protein